MMQLYVCTEGARWFRTGVLEVNLQNFWVYVPLGNFVHLCSSCGNKAAPTKVHVYGKDQQE